MSVLIVTYNSARYIDGCLTSLEAALRGIDAEVVVLDNASTDDTFARLAEHPQVEAIPGVSNAGFAAACNRLAERSRGRYLFFLNPDTTIDSEAVHRLLAAADETPAAGIYGARTVTPDGRPVFASAQGRMTMWSLICFATGLSTLLSRRAWANPEVIPNWDRTTSRTVPVLSGGALLVRRDVWAELGGFDSRYFMYAEDADLCARALTAGYRPLFVAPAVVTHAVGGSSSEGRKLVLLHRGKVTYVHKHWPHWQARCGTRLLLVGVAVRAFAARVGAIPDVPGRSSGGAWREAWKNRADWRHGWGAAGTQRGLH